VYAIVLFSVWVHRASAREHAFRNERGSKCYRACFSERPAGASATEHAFQHYELSRDVKCGKKRWLATTLFLMFESLIRQSCVFDVTQIGATKVWVVYRSCKTWVHRASAREHAFRNERGGRCYRACFSERPAGASATEHAFQHYELSRDI